MRSLSKLFIITSILLSTQLKAEVWTDYIPTDKVLTAKLMILDTSNDRALIGQKMQAAISKNPEWFKEYISQIKPGVSMPYHENLGITHAEYEMILNPKAITLKEKATYKLEFKWKEKDKSIIIKTEPTSPIDGIIITKDEVTTPFGALTEIKPINNTNKNAPTGPWSGIRWSYNNFKEPSAKDFNEAKGKAIQFALGKLENTGEAILYYDVKDINLKQQKKVVFSYISYYPLTITTKH